MRMVTMRAQFTNAIVALLLATLAAWPAIAATVGERHLVAHEASAALRNASHSDELRITVWYPAAAQARSKRRSTSALPTGLCSRPAPRLRTRISRTPARAR